MKKALFLISLIFGFGLARASVLPPNSKIETIDDFSGGLNTAYSSSRIDKQFSPYMRNVFIDEGSIERVNGFAVLGTTRTLTKVTGIYPYERETGQVTFLVTDSSITLETTDFNTWTLVSSASNAGAILRWFQVRNKMWGYNGIDFVRVYDGTRLTILNGNLSPTGAATPNVPKFKFAQYYLDRVFAFNVPSAASDIYFTSVITTDNVIIAPDDSRAWPSVNNLHVGQGDGQVGTALWIYQGLLRAGKERSIYTIYGDQPTNFIPKKEEANIGVVSDESITVLDGKSHFLGQDGIYKNVDRISDLIQPDVEIMGRGLTSVISNIWDSQADFGRGQFVFGTTATAAGFVQSEERTLRANTANSPPTGNYIQLNSTGVKFTDNNFLSGLIPGTPVPSNVRMYPSQINFWARTNRVDCGIFVDVTYANKGNIALIPLSHDATILTTSFSRSTVAAFNTILDFDAYEINTGSVSVNLDISNTASDPTCVYDIYLPTETNKSDFTFYASSIVQYISDIATFTSVTAHGSLDAITNTNAGTVQFYVRTATSVINMSTQTWMPITPGANINAPTTNNFVQWASTINGRPSIAHPNIDNVTITHIEGQSSAARAVALDWKNRYWLSVSTGGNQNVRTIYVKSKTTNKNPDAWMPIEGMPVCAFAKDSSKLYGGSCSTGSVLRLDYGTNFNGSTITATYDTPDMVFRLNYFDKNIYKYLFNGSRTSGGIMTLGKSINGSNFSYSTFSITGSGDYTKVLEGVRGTQGTRMLRLRLIGNQLDKDFSLDDISIIYEPTQVLLDR